MVYQGIEFFNVVELEPHNGGVALQRFPESVRENLGRGALMKGRIVSRQSTGSELRFVTKAHSVRLYLSTADSDGEATVYRGDHFHSRQAIRAGAVTAVDLEEPQGFENIAPGRADGAFSSSVWRVLFDRNCAVFHGLESYGFPVRPPEPDELPPTRWIAYGSSITQGASAQAFDNSYVPQAAKRLGIDALCLGLSGACYCEKEVADFIASDSRWDIASLELGVNMRGAFTVEEFRERAAYLIRAVLERNPGKPVVLISPFTNHADAPADPGTMLAIRNAEYRIALQELYREYARPTLFFMDGRELVPDFSLLTCDFLHPSAIGHIRLGELLAERLRPLLVGRDTRRAGA